MYVCSRMDTVSPTYSGEMGKDKATKLDELRKLLLAEDRPDRDEIREKVSELEELLGSREALAEHLQPHFMEHQEHLQAHFPELFGKSIASAIKSQIRDSQDEIIDALHPIIGKLIVQYVKMEIQRISQEIDRRLEDPFSFKNLRLRFKALVTGIPYEDLLMQDIQNPHVEQIFLISKDTGFPLGTYSINDVGQKDMIAGMLTGIKSFVEDAFQTESQELQTVSYDKYQILLISFQTFYFAIVVDEIPHARFQEKLREEILKFCEKHPVWTNDNITGASQEDVSKALKEHFHGFNEAN